MHKFYARDEIVSAILRFCDVHSFSQEEFHGDRTTGLGDPIAAPFATIT
jgi:hypothetical protein